MARTPSSAKATLRVYLLGAFRIERDTRPIALPTRKVESLLAYLALFPELHPREKLAALLWGDSTDELARHSLRSALTTLRSKLGDDVLLADRETVQLNPDYPLWIDAREFEQTAHDESTISLYQGDLLADFYDDWVEPERERLRALYHDSLLQLAQAARSHSQYIRAIELAQKVLASDPANEKAYQHIIFCLATTGDRIGALKQYDECEKRLRDELGVKPSSETVALREQIERELTGAPSREALLTNLPTPLTSFIGRQSELAEIKQLLTATRLLTLTGAGGCGKTRLAIQVATDLASRDVPAERLYKNGVWWVDLAALNDPALVPQKVAQVFDLRESVDAPLITVLTNYLRAKELLLVLDNCEHLIAACAQLAETLLSACPRLQILATSREALGLTGEVAWYVPSLESPDPQHLPPLDSLPQYDAIRLLTERAQAVVPHWQLADHAEAAARICCRLDGIPLAIELAAARLKVLAAEQVAERLDDRFQLLTGGSRTTLPRHRTLRATIDWSYELLAEEERILFQRLAVFAGGCTLAAMESVCCGGGMAQGNLLDALTRLVDKSLVVVDNDRDGRRYRMLETIRQYAHEKLIESGELRAMRDRHLDYFLRLAEEGAPYIRSGETAWLDRLETEFDDVRAAWERAIESDAELALRLASALEWFWQIRGNPKEGWTWLTRLLPRTEEWGTCKRRARALRLAGTLANWGGDTKSARPLLAASLAIAEAICDKHEVALTLHNLGRVFLRLGNWSEARTCYEDSQALYRQVGDAWSGGYTTMGLGQLAYGAGDYESARTLLEQSLSLFRNLVDKRGLLTTLNALGKLARLQDDYVRAAALYTESLQLAREIVDWRRQVVMLENLGYVALHECDYVRARALFEEGLALYRQCERAYDLSGYVAGFAGIIGANGKSLQAAQLLGAVEASYQALGTVMAPADRKEYDHILAAVRAQLDEATFNAAWEEGRKMTLEQAIEYALKA